MVALYGQTMAVYVSTDLHGREGDIVGQCSQGW